jgi:light-regulated signal transduction histidine kinase (bacteriophytochrome)
MTGDVPQSVELSICDREPIHTPGAIQPHGVLLALDPDDMRIDQIAGDTQALLGASHSALLGQNVEARLGAVAATRLTRILADEGPRSCSPSRRRRATVRSRSRASSI